MIECLYIQNFQNWIKHKVEFHPQITTIVGPTDSGKSAIIRLLKWVMLNQPRGDGFIRDGAKGTMGRVVIDGRAVTRRRGKGVNEYLLDREKFAVPSTGVPDEISKFLNVGETNFQGQWDAPFWFSKTAGEVSRQLNAVVDLGVIDDSLSHSQNRLKHYQQVVSISKERVAAATKTKNDLAWVVDADIRYKKVEELEQQYHQIKVRAATLRGMVASIRSAQAAVQRYSSEAAALRKVGMLGVEAKRIGTRRQQLTDLLCSIREKQAILSKPVPDYSRLAACVDSYNAVVKKRNELSVLIHKIRRGKVACEDAAELAKADHAELEKHLVGKCPICGKEI